MAPPVKRRANTTRAAKTKATQRLRQLVNHREEVTFPNIQDKDEEFDIPSDSDEDTADFSLAPPHLTPVTASRTHTMRRVHRLEADVADVRAEVAGINSKLDLLVNAAMATERPTRHSTPPLYTQAANTYSDNHDRGHERYEQVPPPARLRAAANHDEYVDRAMARDRFAPPPAEGKTVTSHSDSERPFPKPYMYVNRDSSQTMKQRLEVRSTLAPLEYIAATLALLRDRRAYHPQDQDHIMRHLEDVTNDAAERPWTAVRKWSQSVWDQVENGDVSWPDYQLIQNARMRIAYAPGSSGVNNATTSQTGITEVVCREHGRRAGCKHTASHLEGNVRHLHVCAFCDCINRACGHGVYFCEKKLQQRALQDRHTQQGQINHIQPQPWRQNVYNMPPPQQQPMYASKNGQAAPRQY